MKQIFKYQNIFLVILCSLNIVFASCSNEDIVQKSNEVGNDSKLTAFSADGPTSRTSMTNNGAFYWEAGDKIWVKDDTGTWRVSSNTPTEKTASFTFKVLGQFTKKSKYMVFYPGKNGNQNQVTISDAQEQVTPNSSIHFGPSGDCGSAEATGTVGGGNFNFHLNHQATYIIFQPYTTNSLMQDCYLTKIEVSSNNDISGTYTLDLVNGTLTGTGSGNEITLTTKGSGSYANGFLLTNNASDNVSFMVVKPGTHTFKVRYWVKDKKTNIEGTITKTYVSQNLDKNKYYKISDNLGPREYKTDNYYMWDAKNHFWYGHESSQPTVKDQSNENYPKFGDPLNRYFNNYGNSIAYEAATDLFKTLPNANEMSWYCMKGDPHWDANELWMTMGHLHKGIMWFLKKNYIAGFSKEIGYDNKDYRSTIPNGAIHNDNLKKAPLSADDANKYFSLPLAGFYDYNGTLKYIDEVGYYWSSSAYPVNSGNAYRLYFSPTHIDLGSGSRIVGGKAQKFY